MINHRSRSATVIAEPSTSLRIDVRSDIDLFGRRIPWVDRLCLKLRALAERRPALARLLKWTIDDQLKDDGH